MVSRRNRGAARLIKSRRSAAYKDYINSKEWAIKKAQYWAATGPKQCQACGSRKLLHVHHRTYDRFGREELSDLVGLCTRCHGAVHNLHRRMGGSLAFWTDRYVYLTRRARGL